jgi:hypothetical protein
LGKPFAGAIAVERRPFAGPPATRAAPIAPPGKNFVSGALGRDLGRGDLRSCWRSGVPALHFGTQMGALDQALQVCPHEHQP